ncbi:hypothetical protein Trydic_g9269 [Trypoxylus dichotomus]
MFAGQLLAPQCVSNSSWEPSCERRCDSLKKCSKFKNQECFCKEGYYRNPVTGACVTKRQCSTKRAIGTCASKRRCEHKCSAHRCKSVKRDCYCMPGFFRDPHNLECVREPKCIDQKPTTVAHLWLWSIVSVDPIFNRDAEFLDDVHTILPGGDEEGGLIGNLSLQRH